MYSCKEVGSSDSLLLVFNISCYVGDGVIQWGSSKRKKVCC